MREDAVRMLSKSLRYSGQASRRISTRLFSVGIQVLAGVLFAICFRSASRFLIYDCMNTVLRKCLVEGPNGKPRADLY